MQKHWGCRPEVPDARFRVMTVMGTRPEAIKLAPIILELRRHSEAMDSLVCSTGQHREMLTQALEPFDIAPDLELGLMRPGQTLADLAADALRAMDVVLARERPQIILVQGDTTTAMAGAMAGYYNRIPVAHVEAGLRTGDRYRPYPEEVNRKLITSLADWHYAPTRTAVDALLAEAVPEASILLTGNPVIDALLYVSAQVPEAAPSAERIVLVTAHRRESFGAPFQQMCLAMRDLVRRNADLRIVYPVHPNPHVLEPVNAILAGEPRVDLLKPLSYRELAAWMKRSYLILTDSGGIQEEAPALGKPVLVMRDVTERPEAVAAGTARLVGTDRERIVREAERLLSDSAAYREMAQPVSPYGDGHAAERIVAHLQLLARQPKSDPARRT